MPDNVLFIGHSLVGPIMPAMFNSFMAHVGSGVRADAQIINGAPLRYGWDNGGSAQGVNARAALPGGDYGAVIVTEAIPLADQIRWNDSAGYAKRYYDLALSANPATRFFVYETWHEIGGSAANWRAQIASDLSLWTGIVDHVNAGGGPAAQLIPAGQAMARLHDAIAAGQVPGLSSIRDLFDDNIHFNATGAWFIAALQARVVAGVDVADLPLATASPWGSPYPAPSAALAAAFGSVINQTLTDFGGASTVRDPVTSDILGGAGDDDLTGTDAADRIEGRGGNDVMSGGGGNDTLDGGAGWDTVTVAASWLDVTLTLSGDAITLTDRSWRNDGTDRLESIEALHFDSGPRGSLNLTTVDGVADLSAQALDALITLYIAYYDRAPDALGLAFWGNAYADGMRFDQIAAAFMDQPETRATYPDWMSAGDVVARVYNNVLGRAPDADGFDFWQAALESGAVDRDQFILSVLDGVQAAAPRGASASFVAQQRADQDYLDSKAEIGAAFAVHRGFTDISDATGVMQAFDGSWTGFQNAMALVDASAATPQFRMPILGVLEASDGF